MATSERRAITAQHVIGCHDDDDDDDEDDDDRDDGIDDFPSRPSTGQYLRMSR